MILEPNYSLINHTHDGYLMSLLYHRAETKAIIYFFRVGGMCHKDHACVIGELGVTTSTGKPYPSAGFTAVYVMAHEIGHNLGMSHDHSVSPII